MARDAAAAAPYASVPAGSSGGASSTSQARVFDDRAPYLMEGEILKVFPTGLIERPQRYNDEEWRAIMLENPDWPQPPEAHALTTFTMATLDGSALVLEAAEAVRILLEKKKIKRAQLQRLCDAMRLQCAVVEMGLQILDQVDQILQSMSVIIPGNVFQLRQLHHKRLLQLDSLFGQMAVARSLKKETLANLRHEWDSYHSRALSLARVELEDMIFLIQKHLKPFHFEKAISKADSLYEFVLSDLATVVIGAVPKSQRRARLLTILNTLSGTTVASLPGSGIVLALMYNYKFSKPLRQIVAAKT